jgi:preprotein translocase subunit YajC
MPRSEAEFRMSGLLLPVYIIIFVALIYFVGIRPQQKRRKELELLSSSLRAGDEIVTAGGIYGIVSEVEEGGSKHVSADSRRTIEMEMGGGHDSG